MNTSTRRRGKAAQAATEGGTQLVRYEAARAALEAAVQFDEVTRIMSAAKQAEVYARQASDNELIEKATEIRVRAQRKAGEMLMQAAQTGQRATPANGVERGANKHLSQGATSAPTLAEIGITKSESSRYQQLAAMPAEHFETAVATAKATAGEVTTAFLLRAAKSRSQPRKLNKVDQARMAALKDATARGASTLSAAAHMTLRSLDDLTPDSVASFTVAEMEALTELVIALRQLGLWDAAGAVIENRTT